MRRRKYYPIKAPFSIDVLVLINLLLSANEVKI